MPYRLWFAGLIGTLTVLAGCTKFRAHTTPDFTPFAEQTIQLLGTADYELLTDDVVWTRSYWDENDPDERKLATLASVVTQVQRAVIAYSVQIVALSESTKPEKEKAKDIAEFLTILRKPVAEWADTVYEVTGIELDLPPEYVDSVMVSIRAQKSLVAALSQAQPLVNEIASWCGAVLDELLIVAGTIAENIESRIYEGHRDLESFWLAMREEQAAALGAIELIQTARRGDVDALTRLNESRAFVLPEMAPGSNPTPERYLAAEEFLIGRLELIDRAYGAVTEDIEFYGKAHAELSALVRSFLGEVRRSRIGFVAWSQAHARMAAGQMTPAEWFDITDTDALMLKALDTAF